MAAHLRASFDASHAAYLARLAAGTQPRPPAGLSGAGSGALAFLDYTDDAALLRTNGLYLVAVALLYAVMRWRGAGFELRAAMIVYNALCVGLAAYVVVGVVRYKLASPGGFACNALDDSPAGRQLAHVLWVYYAQKFLEYGDTLFFVLRLRLRQLTFLHVYHHVSITLVTALFLRYDVNGDSYLPALANSLVHVLMYSHYLLSAFGVDAWWKRQLTALQLVQFGGVMAQSVYSAWRGQGCGFPNWLKVVMIAYQLTMLGLFGAFFVSSYLGARAKRIAKGKAKVK